ncbi:hypothetical protein ABG067_002538 [Albugo candida]
MSRTCVIACIAVQCIAAMKEEGSQSLFQVFDEKYHQNWTLPTSNDLLDASGIDTSILYHPPPSVPASPPDQSPAPVPSPGPVPATQPVPAIVPDSNASLSNSSSSDPSSLSASPQPEFNGWTRVVHLHQLEKFFVVPGAITFDKNSDYTVERLIALRANRRVDFAQYTHGFIGGTQDFVGEDPTLTVKNTTLYRVTFDTNGTAIFQSTATNLYWAYKIADRKIVWVRDPSLAVRLEIYLHTVNRDAIFLKHGHEVLSFRGNLYSNNTQSTQSRIHGLGFLSILCENAIFYSAKAPKAPSDLNAYILKYRKRELTSASGSFSALFAPYDLALLLPQQRPLTDYPFDTIYHPYEWFNTLFTMTQLIVQNIPEYRDMYPTFGAALPHDLNINRLIDYIQLPNTSVWTRDGAYRLLSIATAPPVISSTNSTHNLARQEWAGLVGTMISCAWMHDYDHKRQGILDSNQTNLHTILQTFYLWSSILVDVMIPNAPLLKKLDQVFILHPFGSIGAYLEKDSVGHFWFDRFLAPSSKGSSIVSELRLLLYIGDNTESTMIGSDIISTLLNETAPFLLNDISRLVEYIAQDTFTALQTIAVKVCRPGSFLVFCNIQPLIAEFQSIRSTIESAIPSNKTTSLMGHSPQDALGQLIDPELQRKIIDRLHVVSSRLSFGSEASAPLFYEFAQTEGKLASYLEKCLVFECVDRIALFNEKISILLPQLENAAREKAILVKIIGEFPSSNLVVMTSRIFDLIFVALVAYNPFSKYTASFSLNSIQLELQDVQQVGNYVIDLVRIFNLDRYWSHEVFNTLLTTLMRVAMGSKVVQSFTTTILDPLIQPSHVLDEHELEASALQFVVAYAQLNLPVEDAGIQELQNLILKVSQSFCDEWAGLVGTMISCAWMHDYDHKRQGILDSNQTNLHTILQTFYLWSSILVDVMIPNAPLLKKLDQVFILHPFGSIGAYLEKDSVGHFWFDRFLAPSSKGSSIVSELRLLLYIGDNTESTMIGSDIISTLLNETAPFLLNDISRLVEYIAQDTFTALQTIAVKVCRPGSFLVFCNIQPLIAEFQSIRSTIESAIPSNKTTSLMGHSPQDALGQLIDPELQRKIIDRLHVVSSRLSFGSEASAPLFYEFAQTEGKLASYLEKCLVFECVDRIALFNEKISILLPQLENAAREKAILVKIIGEFPSSNLVVMTSRIFDLIFVALVAYNPFSKYTASFSLNSIQLELQDVQQVGNYVIDLVRIFNLDRYWSHEVFNTLLTTLMRVAMGSKVVQSFTKTILDPLIQPSHVLDEHELEASALQFVVAYAQLNLPVEDAGIQELQNLILKVSQSFCDVIDHKSTAFSTCKMLQLHANAILQNLCSSLQLSLQALDLLSDIASAIVSKQQTQLARVISSQIPKSVQFDTVWQLRLSSLQTTSNVLLVIHRSQIFKTIVAYCNRLAYIRSGFLSPTCARIFVNKPISDQEIRALAAETWAPPSEITLDALIPSRPQFVGDTGFLDISKLMNGDVVSFQLPPNTTWLQQFHWLNGIGSGNVSIVVENFDIYLMPRFASFISKKSLVVVQVNASGLSSFGPLMNEKMVEIPSVSFANTYEERPAHLAGTCHFVTLPAHTCNTNWPQVCSLNGDEGHKSMSLLPSLFTPFQVQAIFPEKAFRPRDTLLEFNGLTSPLYLTARLRVRVTSTNTQTFDENEPLISTNSPKTKQHERRLNPKLGAGQRCCPVGQFKDWMDGECRDCNPNSVSQLGGMYCVSIANQTIERRKQMRL